MQNYKQANKVVFDPRTEDLDSRKNLNMLLDKLSNQLPIRKKFKDKFVKSSIHNDKSELFEKYNDTFNKNKFTSNIKEVSQLSETNKYSNQRPNKRTYPQNKLYNDEYKEEI
jgi:hypothetical protein